MGGSVKKLLGIAAPIAGSLLLPGLGTALGIGGLTAGGTATALGGALGGGIGGVAGGALQGGGLKSALIGGGLGATGGYLANGGTSQLLGGTALGNTLGLSNPEGGSLIGNALGSSSASPNSLGSLLSGSGASGSPLSAGDTSFLNKANISSQGFSPAETNFLSNAGSATRTASGLGSALGGGVGGAGSSYGGLNTLATLGGAANSMYANSQAQKDLLSAQNNALGQIKPYQVSGAAANSRLSDLLGTSGNTTSTGFGTLGQPYTPADLTQDPGYQFQLQQGNQALDRQQAAKGDYFSGSALKAAQDYGQGLADTTYNNAYQRYLQQQQQQYGMLAGQSGQGASAAGTAAGINENTGNAKANAGISSSNILNSSLSSLLTGSGAKRLVGYGMNGQPLYA